MVRKDLTHKVALEQGAEKVRVSFLLVPGALVSLSSWEEGREARVPGGK